MFPQFAAAHLAVAVAVWQMGFAVSCLAGESTPRAHACARVEELSRTGELTALPHCRTIPEQLTFEHARGQRSGRPLGVALAGIDDLKRYKGTLGHECQDEVLRLPAAAKRVPAWFGRESRG